MPSAMANGNTNGVNAPAQTNYGNVAADKVLEATNKPTPHISHDHSLVLQSFRLLIADLCQQYNGGHPG